MFETQWEITLSFKLKKETLLTTFPDRLFTYSTAFCNFRSKICSAFVTTASQRLCVILRPRRFVMCIKMNQCALRHIFYSQNTLSFLVCTICCCIEHNVLGVKFSTLGMRETSPYEKG